MSAVRLARAATGRAGDRQVRRLLPRPRRCAAGRRRARAWRRSACRNPGRDAARRRRHARAPFNDLAAVERCSRRAAPDIAAVMVEPVAGNMGVVPPAPGFLEGLRGLTAQHGALLVFDEVMTGLRVRPRGAQALYGVAAGPHLPRQGHRRRAAGRGLRRTPRMMEQIAPAGPVYQAGTLSGNPLAMAAGLATLDILACPGVWERAERWAARAAAAMNGAAAAAGVALTVQRVGTMLTPFFTEQPVHDYTDAKRTDRAAFGASSTQCSMPASTCHPRPSRRRSRRRRTARRSSPPWRPRSGSAWCAVAIVGGGVAGLTAAYRLKQRGVRVVVYEASERVGRDPDRTAAMAISPSWVPIVATPRRRCAPCSPSWGSNPACCRPPRRRATVRRPQEQARCRCRCPRRNS